MEYDLDGMDVLFCRRLWADNAIDAGQQGVLCGCAGPAAKTDAR